MTINTSGDQEESISHFNDWKRLLMLHVSCMVHEDLITFITYIRMVLSMSVQNRKHNY